MELHDVADVSQVVGAFALFVTVVILIFNLRENNRLVRAANTQALVNLSSPFTLALIQDRAMAELCLRGASNVADMDDVDRHRYRNLLVWWLVFYENIFFQWNQRLLSENSFRPWKSDLKQFARQQQLWKQWDQIKQLFEKKFAVQMTQIVAECQAECEAAAQATPTRAEEAAPAHGAQGSTYVPVGHGVHLFPINQKIDQASG